LTRVWAKRGTRPAAPRDQRRIWAYILGAVCPARRATSALVMPYLNATAVSAHLADISREVAEGAQAVLVLDGAGFHVAKDLKIPRNITLLRLPPYSPELNPIENVWEYLRGNKLANTVYETYDELVTACCNAWNFFVEDPERVASVTTRSWAKVNT
jgi:transposase